MSDKNVFEKAVEIIHERGWTQGGYVGDDGAVCTVGALHLAINGDTASFSDLSMADTEQSGAGEHLRTLVCEDSSYVARWNDDPHRTVEDVFLALKEAASTWDGD